MNTSKRLTAAVVACAAALAGGYIATATTDPSDPGQSTAGSSPSTDSASSAPSAASSTAANPCQDVLAQPPSAGPPVDAQAPAPGGATLTADYGFENSLASSVGGAPDLAEAGDVATGYADDTVLGQARPVLTFSGFTGLSLSPSSEVIEGGEYTIELLFRFDHIGGFRKIIDFNQGTEDCGLYFLDGRLDFFPVALAVGSPVEPDSYVHVVLTRNGSGTLTGYVNGARQFSLHDRELGLVDANDTLLFFRDDPLSNEEYSSGAVAGIRLYDGPLSADEVAGLAAELSIVSPPPTENFCPFVDGGTCLNAIDAGTYTTALFEPSITYTVPDGWVNREDLPGNFLLHLDGDERYVGIYRDATAPLDCEETPDPDVGTSVEAWSDWLTSHPGLVTTEPQPVNVGGLDGVYIDIGLDPEWTATCPFSQGEPVVPFIFGGGPSFLHHVILPGFEERLYLLNHNGGNIAIEVGPEGGSLPDYLELVEPIIDSIEFGDGGLSTAASDVPPGVTGRIVFDRLQGVFGYESPSVGTFTMDLSGSSEQELDIDVPMGEGISPTWSPDGNSLLVGSGLRPAITDADGSNLSFIEPDELSSGYLRCIAWSPDGSSLVCTFDDDAHPDTEGIYTVGVDGSNLTRVTSSPNPSVQGSISGCGGNDIGADYSPDGSRIAFLRAECGPGEDPSGGQQATLYVVNSDGTGLEEIVGDRLPNSHDFSRVRWSPDGTRILFGSERGKLYLVDPDGTDLTEIELDLGTGNVFAYTPAWSPDGSFIVFSLFSSGTTDLYVARPDGTDVTRITDAPDAEVWASWTDSH
jgi:Tol biopolymer transport system component